MDTNISGSIKEIVEIINNMVNLLDGENKTVEERVNEHVDEWFNNLPEDEPFKQAINEIDKLKDKDIGMPQYCYYDEFKECPHYGMNFCVSPCDNCKSLSDFNIE